MTVRPHRQYMALARLMELLANETAQALEHLIEERSHLGWPHTTMGDGGSRATTTDTRPERDSTHLIEINSYIDQIQEDITTIASLASSALDVTRQAKGHRVPRNPTQPDTNTYCHDGQVGKAGVAIWGSPCYELPVKGSMCNAHYLKWFRYRKAHDIDVSRDFEPAEI